MGLDTRLLRRIETPAFEWWRVATVKAVFRKLENNRDSILHEKQSHKWYE
jgi:hypothetical protein